MQIITNQVLSSIEITNDSPWNSFLASWSSDLSSLLNNPALQQNLLGQIEAIAQLAAQSGSPLFANLFQKFSLDYTTFLQNPTPDTLKTISGDIAKLISAAPQNPLSYNKVLALSCELLLYKMNPYNPTHNQDEIAGMMSAILQFLPTIYQGQMTQIETDYANYLKYGDSNYFYSAQNLLNGLISMLRA